MKDYARFVLDKSIWVVDLLSIVAAFAFAGVFVYIGRGMRAAPIPPETKPAMRHALETQRDMGGVFQWVGVAIGALMLLTLVAHRLYRHHRGPRMPTDPIDYL